MLTSRQEQLLILACDILESANWYASYLNDDFSEQLFEIDQAEQDISCLAEDIRNEFNI